MATKEDGIIILMLYPPNTINYRNATWYILGPISMIWTPTILSLIHILYNLKEDPEETNNLAKKYPRRVKEFDEEMQRMHIPVSYTHLCGRVVCAKDHDQS